MKKMSEQELVDLKKKIDTFKQKQSELKGKKKALIEGLANFGCKTLEEAEKKALKMQDEIEALDEEREKGIKDIEDNYEF
jgi:hypothetical protein